ncbi:TPA_asm: helix-turn-helix domain-containing protein [Listeria monocytogenes]|uniref:Helix-turn-helix transcriptional regulator n=1 Tax=Listeria monocytogenes TaxID=1639 RepID=A0A472HFL6_LISMN|nr:helix-turn-helix transcriptional regulator [Listeria monocytogenes]EAG6290961.1 XRE family transcriptional regulator [Listeria monocytogenes CFSAN003825]EAG6318215.1 XRE family transcriptional regulator [Listeria monocytogenes CFSAN003824]EAG6342114.1 XRE family transcriptional regulator [Listeria monocytogenes CFSAN003811]AQP58395.1 transcriptional regulator [Listeria monocytogenes]AVS32615.1 XRE family transcriptional regulator [Listeria monocytogenes]
MFGNRLKQLRKNNNKTQEDISKILGISRGAYSHIENGRNEPDMETIVKLANIFGVSTDYLLGRSNNGFIDTIAAHIDSNATEEEIKEILAYIEEKRKEYANEEEIDITDIAAKKDTDVAKFVEENPDFKAVAARVMDDEEAVKAVKTFIEYYEQQKKK